MRPTVGSLTVPFVVDESRRPIDFRQLDPERVKRCAKHRRCGVCGSRIDHGKPLAFIGPDDGRSCYADPWMHVECAELAAQQCPFIRGRDWRDGDPATRSLVAAYVRNMVVRVVQEARVHRELGAWHFEVVR